MKKQKQNSIQILNEDLLRIGKKKYKITAFSQIILHSKLSIYEKIEFIRNGEWLSTMEQAIVIETLPQ
jgi:hypothetical protein